MQKKTNKKLVKYSILFFVIFVFGYLSYDFISNAKLLPPITTQGHIEISPKSHILDYEMPENVQKHMLEHADGKGRPGVIIHYNCAKFECEEGLVDKLIAIVNKYPDFVYLSPSNKYDGKIILTKYQKRLILDSFNKEEIINFIEGR